MGRGERGWIACLGFLGFLVSVESITRGELFPFGPSAGDQILTAGNDQTHQLELENPVLFYDGTFDSIFVSSIGVLVIAWMLRFGSAMSADLAQLSGEVLCEQGSAVKVKILNNAHLDYVSSFPSASLEYL